MINVLILYTGLLEKHKQMQERSAIKSQTQVYQNSTNIASTPVNPVLPTANGLYMGNPAALVPYPSNYFMGSPMVQCTSTYNPNPMLQPVSPFFNTNSMLQTANNYLNTNPMLQPVAAANNFFHPNPVLQNPTNYFTPQPLVQFPHLPQNYFNQSVIPQCNNNYFNPNIIPNFQNNNFIQNPLLQCPSTNYTHNLVSQYLNGNINQNFLSQCIDNNNYGRNLEQQHNINFNQTPVSQSVNSTINQNFVKNLSSSAVNYNVANRIKPQDNNNPIKSKNKVYVNPRYSKTIRNVDSTANTQNQVVAKNEVPVGLTIANQTNAQGKQHCNIHVNRKFIAMNIPDEKEENYNVEQSCVASSASSSSIPSKSTDTAVNTDLPVEVNSSINAENNASSDLNSNVNEFSIGLDNNNHDIESVQDQENNDEVSQKNANSSIVVLTRSKLIRIKKNPKITTGLTSFMKPEVAQRRRLVSAGSKKLKISPKKISSPSNQLYNMRKLKYVNPLKKKVL